MEALGHLGNKRGGGEGVFILDDSASGKRRERAEFFQKG